MSILSFQLFPPICYFFPFVSTLTSRFTENLKRMQFARKAFFSSFQGWGHSGWYLPSKQPLAATCGHLRPLAPAATCGHLRPLEWLQVAASGCKWLQIMQMAASDAALEISNPTSRTTGHMRPRAATCGHLP